MIPIAFPSLSPTMAIRSGECPIEKGSLQTGMFSCLTCSTISSTLSPLPETVPTTTTPVFENGAAIRRTTCASESATKSTLPLCEKARDSGAEKLVCYYNSRFRLNLLQIGKSAQMQCFRIPFKPLGPKMA